MRPTPSSDLTHRRLDTWPPMAAISSNVVCMSCSSSLKVSSSQCASQVSAQPSLYKTGPPILSRTFSKKNLRTRVRVGFDNSVDRIVAWILDSHHLIESPSTTPRPASLDLSTFYLPGERGYTDYPTLAPTLQAVT